MNSGALSLLREAAEWRLIGVLFECPREDWQAQVVAMAKEVSDADLKAAAEAARGEAGEGLYHTIFGPGGPAAPREVSHRETLQPGYLLGELAAYYRAFAYQPATLEPPDHVAIETGFVAYLRLKQAYAEFRGDANQASIVHEAAVRFLAEHINTLAEPLAMGLAASGISYLSRTADALLKRAGPRRQLPDEKYQPAQASFSQAACSCSAEDE